MELPQKMHITAKKTLQIINWEIMDATIQIVIASDETISVNGSPVALAHNLSQINESPE
jgi:hypothetical protein